jgi:hypothetical protein
MKFFLRIISIILFFIIAISNSNADDNNVEFTDKNNTSNSKLSDSDLAIREKQARDEVYNQITDITKIRPLPGGPNLGDGSKYNKSKSLSKYIESTWPSNGVTLFFPNREYRVSFNTYVDSRTFEGKVTMKDNGEVAYGFIDQAPALFTRSELTKSITKDIFGVVPTLSPGEYIFEFKVNKKNSNEKITGKIEFVMGEKINSQGAGNHRHGMYKFKFEKELFDITRGIIAFLFALTLFSKNKFTLLNTITLGFLSIFYILSLSLRSTDSILSLNEILSRADTWGFLGILIATASMALSKSIFENRVIILLALLFTLLAEYSLNFVGGIFTFIFMISIVLLGSIFISQLLESKKFNKIKFTISAIFIVILNLVYSKLLYNKNNLPTGVDIYLDSSQLVIAILVIVTVLKVFSSLFYEKMSKKFNIFTKALLIIISVYCISILSDSLVII